MEPSSRVSRGDISCSVGRMRKNARTASGLAHGQLYRHSREHARTRESIGISGLWIPAFRGACPRAGLRPDPGAAAGMKSLEATATFQQPVRSRAWGLTIRVYSPI